MNINDFYNGNPLLPKAGTKKELTPDQVQEYLKCAEDPLYFANNYFFALDRNTGELNQIKMYNYQQDALTQFNETGRLIMLTARQVGKALTLDTKIPLFNGGFTTMGEIRVGDIIIGSNGKPTTVTYKSPLMNRQSYRVTFEDGTVVDACEDHLWTVTNRINHRKVETKDTKTLFRDYVKVNARGYEEYRYAIPNIQAVEYASRELLIDPYMLGVWLGDGNSSGNRMTCINGDIAHYNENGVQIVCEESYCRVTKPHQFEGRIKNLSMEQLRHYDLVNNKHIPHDYLYGSIEQRLALLQGLMDTDGFVGKNGLCEIQLTNKNTRLIDDIYQLLSSLGIKVFKKNFVNEKFNTSSTRMGFTPPCGMQVVRIPRKAERIKAERPNEKYTNSRSIVKIEPIGTQDVQCIQVDADDHLFAVSNSYVMTHNTTVATAIILHAALFNRNKNIALLANLQATAIEIMDRIKEAFENLPMFLKQGIRIWNRKTIKFENGCTIFANASKGSSVRGKTIYMLYIDECAFVENWNEFAASTLPAITANKDAKVIYTSTPNGLNHFYDYCRLAKAGKNGYSYVEVPWYKVDGRDQAWKEKTLQDMNYDEEKFAVEQECLTGDAIVQILFDGKEFELTLKTLYYINKIAEDFNITEDEKRQRIHYILIGEGRRV